MRSSCKYKTIFFDWNKTLSYSLFWHQLTNFDHARHDWLDNINEFLFIENKDLIISWMKAQVNESDIANLISNKFGYSKKIIINDLADSCKNMEIVNNEILELIDKIRKKGVKCVIATDNMDTFMKYTKPAMKLEDHFDDFLVSFEMKTLKFDVKKNTIPFFDNYLKKEKLSYNDVLLLDDCIDQSGIYKKLGFKILQITSSSDLVETLRALAR